LEFCDGGPRINAVLWALDHSPAWAGAIFARIADHFPHLRSEVDGWEAGVEERELYNGSIEWQAYLLAVLQSSRDDTNSGALYTALQGMAQNKNSQGVELPSNDRRVAVVEEVCRKSAAAMLAWLQPRLAQ
jgi:hypothetical protein